MFDEYNVIINHVYVRDGLSALIKRKFLDNEGVKDKVLCLL